MGKKRSFQDVKVPRPLNEAETHLYGWVEEAELTQPSVVESDSLPEFRRNFPLMEDSRAERDYVLEAAGPSDKELFTRLGVRLPFSDFQRDVMTRCRVAVSQLHLNGLGFILTFEKMSALWIPPHHPSLQVSAISRSGLDKGMSFLTPMRIRFRSSNETISRSCLLRASALSGSIMRIIRSPGFTGTLR
ncbi:hypothetical protein PIB30_049579 [Stylosanthes scabra]|uniref:Uncharacterized protein n=1 Tax=Stylosanthes scabra TaxID=79078 RepID=A0ABU6TH82_9FABA|nr:hypothetical protein [Stylosanthes scabra]